MTWMVDRQNEFVKTRDLFLSKAMQQRHRLAAAIASGTGSAAIAVVLVSDIPRVVAVGGIAFVVGVFAYFACEGWRKGQNARFVRWLSASLFGTGAGLAFYSVIGVTLSARIFAETKGTVGWIEFWMNDGSGLSHVAFAATAIVAWILATYLALRLPLAEERSDEICSTR